MIKGVCIDGYNTIEDGNSVKKHLPILYDRVAELLGCSAQNIADVKQFYCESFGPFIWEYHEIFWRTIANKYGNQENIEELIEKLYSVFLDYYEDNVELFSDVIPALSVLKEYAKLILVANGNSKRVKRLIRKFQLFNIFSDFVVSSETPHQKPDKFMYEYCIKTYGWQPSEVLMVGDKYDNDVLGAKKCGLLTAIRLSKISAPKSCELTPDFMVDSFYEVIDIVKYSQKRHLYLIPTILSNTECDNRPYCAFIAAAGKGSRLGELGTRTHKSMLPLWGKPIIYYTILSLKSSGCSKIFIAVNHLSEQIEDYFGDGSTIGVEIQYIKNETLGTYDSMFQAADILDDRILYIHANILFQNKLLENIITVGNATGESVIAIVDGKKAGTVRHAQVDIDSSGLVSRIDLQERNGSLPYTFLGVGYYRKQELLKYLQYDNNGQVDRTGMVEKFIKLKLDNNVSTVSYLYSGGWRHIETARDYERIRNENRWEIYYE